MNIAVSAARNMDLDPLNFGIYGFNKQDRVEEFGILYEWLRDEKEGHWFTRLDDAGPPQFFTHDDLWKRFNRKKNPMGYVPARRVQKGTLASTEISNLLSPLQPEEQKSILFCVDWCERFRLAYKNGDVKRTKTDAERWAKEEQAKIVAATRKLHKDEGGNRQTAEPITDEPKGGTLLDWVMRYERADFDPIVFYNRTGKAAREDYFTPDELVVINQYVELRATDKRTPVTELYEMLVGAIERQNNIRQKENSKLGAKIYEDLRVPNIDTFRERINKLPRARVERAHLGKSTATAKNAAVRGGIDVDRPLERIELDESRVDLQTILVLADEWKNLTKAEKDVARRVRLWITAAIDVATKGIFGLRFHPEEPSAASAVATLGMVFQDKTQLSESLGCETKWHQSGNAEEVVVDSATWLASLAMRIAVLDSGACFFQPKAGDPRSKGTIERWFRTLNRDALAPFKGRTWGDPDEMGELDARKQASLAYNQYAHLMYRFLIDVYHNTEHDGLRKETPNAAWSRLRKFYKPSPPMSPNIRRHIFGVKASRKLSNAGVRFLGIYYWSKELHHLFLEKDQEVEVRVDISDLGAISVRHEKGWLTVNARHDEFAGMTVWRWMAFNDKLRIRNKKSAQIHRSVALRTKEYLREQGEIAAAEAQLGTGIVTDEDFKRWEKDLAHEVEIIDDEVDEPDAASLHKESKLTDLYSHVYAGMLAAREKDAAPNKAEASAKPPKATTRAKAAAPLAEHTLAAAKPLISDRFSR